MKFFSRNKKDNDVLSDSPEMSKAGSPIHMNEIELFYEPRRNILPLIGNDPDGPEMSEFESAFLCGTIKKFLPKKIMEVGIAAGATTAIILQCLDMLKLENVEMHSIDFSERFYRDAEKQSGYLGIEAKTVLTQLKVNHQFHLGGIACSYMQQIGSNVDCLILDTMHMMPGEIWDFITLLPYLKNGAVVILHDIILNNMFEGKFTYATGTLFASVVGEKYWNFDMDRDKQYPNIGAFVVNEQTRHHIANLFLSLMITWGYVPDEAQLNVYRAAVKKFYSPELLFVFDMAYSYNKKKLLPD